MSSTTDTDLLSKMAQTSETIPSIPHLLQAHLPGWQFAPTSKTAPDLLSDSFSNLVYRVQNPHAVPQIVILRLYGKGGAIPLNSRKRELHMHVELAQAGIAPPVYAAFPMGRVEHFLHARSPSLAVTYTLPLVTRIATAVAKLHCFEPSDAPKMKPASALWGVLAGWVRRARRLDDLGAFAGSRLAGTILRWAGIMEEARQRVDRMGRSPVVFCHNDLFRGNILVDEDSEVSLIDFEYSSFNYRGYDIGNFFCEAMGGTDNGTSDERMYPSLELRRVFCKAYLEAFDGPVAEERVEELVQEAELYGRLSHLYNGFWALVQSAGGGCGDMSFPYLKYAEDRFRIYTRLVEEDAQRGDRQG